MIRSLGLYDKFVEAGVDVLPLTIDSNTRLNDYEMAKKMLALSEESGGIVGWSPSHKPMYEPQREMVTIKPQFRP